MLAAIHHSQQQQKTTKKTNRVKQLHYEQPRSSTLLIRHCPDKQKIFLRCLCQGVPSNDIYVTLMHNPLEKFPFPDFPRKMSLSSLPILSGFHHSFYCSFVKQWSRINWQLLRRPPKPAFPPWDSSFRFLSWIFLFTNTEWALLPTNSEAFIRRQVSFG